jgi:hypothetical protein
MFCHSAAVIVFQSWHEFLMIETSAYQPSRRLATLVAVAYHQLTEPCLSCTLPG